MASWNLISYEEFDSDGVSIQYDFCADERIREAVRAKVAGNRKSYLPKYRFFYVQRFKKSQNIDLRTLEKACFHISQCPYAARALRPFEIEGDDDSLYVLIISNGRPFDPSKDKDGRSLYEFAPVSDQKMFISKLYMSIIKDILASVFYFIRYIPRVRCVIDLKTLYIDEHLDYPTIFQIDEDTDLDEDGRVCTDWILPNVGFMRFYLLDEGEKDDKRIVIQQLKDLFDEINTKSNIHGPPKEEFKLFMESLLEITMVRDIYNNVVFANKKSRIWLIDHFLQYFMSKESTCDDLVSDAFGEDWFSKLEQHPSLKEFLPICKVESWLSLKESRREPDSLRPVKQSRREPDSVPDIIACLDIISRLYSSFMYKDEGRCKEIENIEELVVIIHCIFPNHIAVLTRWAYKEGLPFPRFEPFAMDNEIDVYRCDEYDRDGYYRYIQRNHDINAYVVGETAVDTKMVSAMS